MNTVYLRTDWSKSNTIDILLDLRVLEHFCHVKYKHTYVHIHPN